MVHAGYVFVASIYPPRTWMLGSFESLQWNTWVQRQGLSFYPHPKENKGMESEPMLTPKEKSPLLQDSKPNTHYPLSYSGPLAEYNTHYSCKSWTHFQRSGANYPIQYLCDADLSFKGLITRYYTLRYPCEAYLLSKKGWTQATPCVTCGKLTSFSKVCRRVQPGLDSSWPFCASAVTCCTASCDNIYQEVLVMSLLCSIFYIPLAYHNSLTYRQIPSCSSSPSCSQAISLGFTILGEIFCVCDRFLIQPLR